MPTYLIVEANALIGPVELPVIPGIGIRLPGNAIELEQELPGESAGCKWAVIDGVPQMVPDLRGEVYNKVSGEPFLWDKLGKLPEVYTTEPKPGPYYIWNADAWALDAELEMSGLIEQALSKRQSMMSAATIQIAPLLDAIELDIATEAEKALYDSWRLYRVQLSRIEQQEGFPRAIVWPETPV